MQGLYRRVRRDEGFKTHEGSPTNLAGKWRSKTEKNAAADSLLNRYSGGYRRWFTVMLVGIERGKLEEGKETGGVAWGGRMTEKQAGEGGCAGEERESIGWEERERSEIKWKISQNGNFYNSLSE